MTVKVIFVCLPEIRVKEFCDLDRKLHASDVIRDDYTDLVRLINQEELRFPTVKNRCLLV